MAITQVSTNTINGFISKTTTDSHYATTGVAMVPGDGIFLSVYENWIANGVGFDAKDVVGSKLDASYHHSFCFDPAVADYQTGEPIDLYDSSDDSNTAYPTNNVGGWDSRTVGTLTDVQFTQTAGLNAGGWVEPLNPSNTPSVDWTFPSKAGTTYATYGAGMKRTFAFWYWCGEPIPSAFGTAWSDNQTAVGNYSGVILQRPSNRDSAFTLLLGNNGGTASGNRRSHLGINGSLALNSWNFVVVGVDGNNIASQGITTNYVNITQAGSPSRNTTNNGISGTSGTATSLVLNSSGYFRFFASGNNTVTALDRIGMFWAFPFYLNANDAKLDLLYDVTKTFYP